VVKFSNICNPEPPTIRCQGIRKLKEEKPKEYIQISVNVLFVVKKNKNRLENKYCISSARVNLNVVV